MKDKIQKLLQSKVGRVIISVFRGTVLRSVPGGNAMIDAVENGLIVLKNKKNAEGQKAELPHKWNTIIAEVGGVALVLYAFYSKLITVEQLKQYIELIFQVLN